MFDTKKPLKGQREPVFPTGVPGATTGIPPDLYKGYQPPPDEATTDTATPLTPVAGAEKPAERSAEKPKPKAKPKPRVARAPPRPPRAKISVGLSKTQARGRGASRPAQTAWPAPTAQSQAAPTAWPAPPPTRVRRRRRRGLHRRRLAAPSSRRPSRRSRSGPIRRRPPGDDCLAATASPRYSNPESGGALSDCRSREGFCVTGRRRPIDLTDRKSRCPRRRGGARLQRSCLSLSPLSVGPMSANRPCSTAWSGAVSRWSMTNRA